jgi:hypothetical protein
MTLSPNEHRYKEPAVEKRSANSTDTYKAARPIVLWVASALGAAALPVAGWAHAKLWDHDGAIKIQAEWQRGHDLNQQRVDDKLEKRLDRMEGKIDAIMAQGHRP